LIHLYLYTGKSNKLTALYDEGSVRIQNGTLVKRALYNKRHSANLWSIKYQPQQNHESHSREKALEINTPNRRKIW